MLFEVDDGLLGAEGAVEIAADAGVARVAGDLADVIDVVDERCRASRRPLAASSCRAPSRHQHPGVERRADDRATADRARGSARR